MPRRAAAAGMPLRTSKGRPPTGFLTVHNAGAAVVVDAGDDNDAAAVAAGVARNITRCLLSKNKERGGKKLERQKRFCSSERVNERFFLLQNFSFAR